MPEPAQYAPRVQRISQRLSADEVKALIKRFLAGTAKHRLAEEYGISLSSIKRLLRLYGVRRR